MNARSKSECFSDRSSFAKCASICIVSLLFSSCERWDTRSVQVEQREASENIHCLTKPSKLPTADCIKLLDAAVARGQIAAEELSPYLFWEVKPGKRTLEVLRVHAAGSSNAWWPLAHLLAQSCDINDVREVLVIYDRMISSPEFQKKFGIPRDRLEAEKTALLDIIKDFVSVPAGKKTQDSACIDFSVEPSIR